MREVGEAVTDFWELRSELLAASFLQCEAQKKPSLEPDESNVEYHIYIYRTYVNIQPISIYILKS